jgi:hypothetical protein
VATKGSVERRLADLYAHVLLEAVGGPYAAAIKASLGAGVVPLLNALKARQARRLRRRSDHLPLDDIDWAAVRAVVPEIQARFDDVDLHLLTGHHLEELAELHQMAVERWREYRTPLHAVSYRIGDCVVELPTAYLARGDYVVAVPDLQSWNAVVPPCARDRRDAFLRPLRRHARNARWIELRVAAVEELRASLDEQAAPYRAAKAQRLKESPARPTPTNRRVR